MAKKEPEFEGKSLFFKVVAGLWLSGLFFLSVFWAYLKNWGKK